MTVVGVGIRIYDIFDERFQAVVDDEACCMRDGFPVLVCH